MKKFILVLALLLVALVGGLAYAAVNVNSYLADNRESLAKLASDSAGREVAFETATVAYKDGLAVRLDGLRVAEDPQFGKADFLQLDEAFVGIRVWPALQKRIEVSGVRLDAPNIRVIQTSKGFNFSTLGGDATSAAAESASDAEQGGAFAVAIAALEIVGGTITYEDRTSRDGLRLVIEDFETSGTDLALEGPIALDFAGRVHSTKPEDKGLESQISGNAAIDSLETAAGTVHLTSPKLFPAIFGVRLEDAGAGVPPERLDNLVVDVVLSENSAKSGTPIKVRSTDARLSGFDLNEVIVDLVYRDTPRGAAMKLDQVAAGLVGGQIEVSGDVVLGEPGKSPFDLDSKITSLDSGQLANILLGVPREFLTGSVGGDANLTGDSLEWESLKRSLAGSLRLNVGEGALEKVNLLDSLVGHLVADPGLGQIAANSIREVAGEVLNGNRTPFKDVKMDLEVVNGAIQANDVSLSAGDFVINAAGTVGLDGAIAADGTIRFSEELSRKILAKADRLAPILGEGGIVTLPLRLGGTASSPSIRPDLRTLTAQAQSEATQELKDLAAKEIGDAIFGKNREEGSEDPAAVDGRGATENLIKEGLGRILGR